MKLKPTIARRIADMKTIIASNFCTRDIKVNFKDNWELRRQMKIQWNHRTPQWCTTIHAAMRTI